MSITYHCKSLPRSCLSICHNTAIDAVQHRLHGVAAVQVVYGLLRAVVEDLVEPELRGIVPVVKHLSWSRCTVAIRHLDRVVLLLDLDRVLREVLRGSRPHAHFHCAPRHFYRDSISQYSTMCVTVHSPHQSAVDLTSHGNGSLILHIWPSDGA